MSESLAFSRSVKGVRRLLVEGNPEHRANRTRAVQAGAVGVAAAICSSASSSSAVVHYAHNMRAVWMAVSGIVEFMPDKYLARFYPNILRAKQAAGGSWERVNWTAVEAAERAHGGLLIPVPRVPLQAILDRLGIEHIDLAIIDTEGAELDVLRTLDLQRVTVDVFAVETDPRFRTPAYAREVGDLINASSAGQYEWFWAQRGLSSWYTRKGFTPSTCQAPSGPHRPPRDARSRPGRPSTHPLRRSSHTGRGSGNLLP